MAITTLEDLNAIQDIVCKDPFISRQGFDYTNVVRQDSVLGDVDGNTKYIMIYPLQFSKAKNISVETSYGIDIIMLRKNVGTAYEISEQIHALLHDVEILPCRTLHMDTAFATVGNSSELVILSGSYKTQSTLYNTLRE